MAECSMALAQELARHCIPMLEGRDRLTAAEAALRLAAAIIVNATSPQEAPGALGRAAEWLLTVAELERLGTTEVAGHG